MGYSIIGKWYDLDEEPMLRYIEFFDERRVKNEKYVIEKKDERMEKIIRASFIKI